LRRARTLSIDCGARAGPAAHFSGEGFVNRSLGGIAPAQGLYPVGRRVLLFIQDHGSDLNPPTLHKLIGRKFYALAHKKVPGLADLCNAPTAAAGFPYNGSNPSMP